MVESSWDKQTWLPFLGYPSWWGEGASSTTSFLTGPFPGAAPAPGAKQVLCDICCPDAIEQNWP